MPHTSDCIRYPVAYHEWIYRKYYDHVCGDQEFVFIMHNQHGYALNVDC